MAIKKIPRGNDRTITLTVKDELGVVIDLSTAPFIRVRVIDKAGNTIDKYSKTVQTGFRLMSIPTPANGEIKLSLNAAQTDTASLGRICADIKLSFVDTDFDDDTKDISKRIDDIAELVESKTKGDL